jgi:hypothetical protein
MNLELPTVANSVRESSRESTVLRAGLGSLPLSASMSKASVAFDGVDLTDLAPKQRREFAAAEASARRI